MNYLKKLKELHKEAEEKAKQEAWKDVDSQIQAAACDGLTRQRITVKFAFAPYVTMMLRKQGLGYKCEHLKGQYDTYMPIAVWWEL